MSMSGDNSTTTLKLTGGVTNKFSGEEHPYLPQSYDPSNAFSEEGSSPFPTNKYKKLAQMGSEGGSPLKIQIQKAKLSDSSYFPQANAAGNDRLETQNSFDQTEAPPSQPLMNDRISQNQIPSFGQPLVHQKR